MRSRIKSVTQNRYTSTRDAVTTVKPNVYALGPYEESTVQVSPGTEILVVRVPGGWIHTILSIWDSLDGDYRKTPMGTVFVPYSEELKGALMGPEFGV